ncbi:hypothetical protein [Flavobacterium columnare]|uniref:HNH nuclease domain-containing protein n=1 Tax=Flavobacterium columnare TaxID=996 RepID=A0AA94JPC6_9FLAO|nr:hypothetical protein [Flavobacterium columnare]MCH4830953.1 hypothetical protein [Flavobacterium columnare]MCH4833106.1 hypothetical protein [Flavobacterium columnare]
MNKIDYSNITNDYKKLILDFCNSGKINREEIKTFLVDFDINICFEDLILLPVEELKNIKSVNFSDIRTKYNYDEKMTKKHISHIKSYFNYSGLQKYLSNFLMNKLSALNLKSCYYCNIDYINTFVAFNNEYFDKYDLINNVEDTIELKLINNIGYKTANKIFNLKGQINSENEYNSRLDKNTRKILDNLFENGKIKLDKIKSHNHFTLDHLMPQKDYIHLSLCLYNLIPVCYSCNSKFKKDKKIYSRVEELEFISPSSSNYDSNIFETLLNFRNGFSLDNVDNKENFKIKINSTYTEYLKILKLQGRYNFHKDISFDMIEKRKKYPDIEINKISNLLGIPANQIKKDIFGKECFESNNEPFEKYKQDIAKQIRLFLLSNDSSKNKGK